MVGTAFYVQAPKASSYGFGVSIVVSGLCLLPSELAMPALPSLTAYRILFALCASAGRARAAWRARRCGRSCSSGGSRQTVYPPIRA